MRTVCRRLFSGVAERVLGWRLTLRSKAVLRSLGSREGTRPRKRHGGQSNLWEERVENCGHGGSPACVRGSVYRENRCISVQQSYTESSWRLWYSVSVEKQQRGVVSSVFILKPGAYCTIEMYCFVPTRVSIIYDNPILVSGRDWITKTTSV